MTQYDDPNREAVGVAPIWAVAEVPEPKGAEPKAAGFDPAEHTVDEVHDYLDEHPDDEKRVMKAERAGKARVGIIGD